MSKGLLNAVPTPGGDFPVTFTDLKLLYKSPTFCIKVNISTLVKVFRIIPEFKILRLTFLRKSASKC